MCERSHLIAKAKRISNEHRKGSKPKGSQGGKLTELLKKLTRREDVVHESKYSRD